MFEYLFHNFYFRNKDGKLDKRELVRGYQAYMYNRLMKMFHYENLPTTIPQDYLEYYLLTNGTCIIKEFNGKYYPFIGNFGGEPDPLYRPTIYVVANPALKMSEEVPLFSIDGELSTECVLMRNDKLWVGLAPLVNRYSYLLAENIITMRVADIMLRVVALLTAPDDKTKAAADAYLKKLIEGELSIVAENKFFDGLKLQSPPSNNGSYLTQFIELQQYYKGSFYNEIGLSASFNMKRESIGEGEATLNEDTLSPLIDTMLEVRQEDVSRLNDLFGFDISVDFDSVWKQNVKEHELEIDKLEADIEEVLNGNEEGTGTGTDYTTGFTGDDNVQSDASDEDGQDGGTDERETDIEKSDGIGDEQSTDDESASSSDDDGTAHATVVNNIEIVIEDGDLDESIESDSEGSGEEGEDSRTD